MIEEGVLLYHVPGVLVSIDFPNSKMPLEILFRTTLKKLAPTLTASTVSVEMDSSEKQASFSALEPSFSKNQNRYANIVEMLERKYSSQKVVSRDKESDESNDHDRSSSEDEGAVTNAQISGQQKKKRKRRMKQDDDYDRDDPFVDDSAIYSEIETTLMMNKTKTKQAGFFVSTGILDVTEEEEKILSSSSVSKKSAPDSNASSNTSGQKKIVVSMTEKKSKKDEGKKDEVICTAGVNKGFKRAALLSTQKMSLLGRTISSGSEKSEALNNDVCFEGSPIFRSESRSESNMGTDAHMVTLDSEGNTPRDATQSMPSLSEGQMGDDEKQKRAKKEKPTWQPCAEVIDALAEFKQKVHSMGISVRKQAIIPSTLEEPLRTLDIIVRHHHTSILSKTSGYYESISEILGGYLQEGKIKKHLKRLYYKASAKEAKTCLHETLIALTAEIKDHISEAASPSAVSHDEAIDETSVVHTEDAEENVSIASTATGPVFKWKCSWKSSMKAMLLQAEEQTIEWVKQENVYRNCITAAEERSLPTSETALLVEKDEVSNMLRDLCRRSSEPSRSSIGEGIGGVFPESCSQADVSTLRRHISSKKSEIKKKKMKEEEQAVAQESTEAGEKKDEMQIDPLPQSNIPTSHAPPKKRKQSGGGGENEQKKSKTTASSILVSTSLPSALKVKSVTSAADKSSAKKSSTENMVDEMFTLPNQNYDVYSNNDNSNAMPPISKFFSSPPPFDYADFREVGTIAKTKTQSENTTTP